MNSGVEDFGFGLVVVLGCFTFKFVLLFGFGVFFFWLVGFLMVTQCLK